MLNNANGQIPVIAVTAHAMTEQKQQLLLSGLDDYLSKPYRLGELMATVTTELGRRAGGER